jgi:1,4-alpha-glucan branching enzyme
MIRKRLSSKPDKVTVTFEIPGSVWAERINLVGDFNDWNAQSLQFQQDRSGNWIIELELDAGCAYRFRYLFDGEHWRDDWHADNYIPNPYGGYDSIVVAIVPPEA